MTSAAIPKAWMGMSLYSWNGLDYLEHAFALLAKAYKIEIAEFAPGSWIQMHRTPFDKTMTIIGCGTSEDELSAVEVFFTDMMSQI